LLNNIQVNQQVARGFGLTFFKKVAKGCVGFGLTFFKKVAKGCVGFGLTFFKKVVWVLV
jgi:hypothetical protein